MEQICYEQSIQAPLHSFGTKGFARHNLLKQNGNNQMKYAKLAKEQGKA